MDFLSLTSVRSRRSRLSRAVLGTSRTKRPRSSSLSVLLVAHGHQQPTWGKADLVAAGTARQHYIGALRRADENDFGPLLGFCR